jgi:hypothetical protein
MPRAQRGGVGYVTRRGPRLSWPGPVVAPDVYREPLQIVSGWHSVQFPPPALGSPGGGAGRCRRRAQAPAGPPVTASSRPAAARTQGRRASDQPLGDEATLGLPLFVPQRSCPMRASNPLCAANAVEIIVKRRSQFPIRRTAVLVVDPVGPATATLRISALRRLTPLRPSLVTKLHAMVAEVDRPRVGVSPSGLAEARPRIHQGRGAT